MSVSPSQLLRCSASDAISRGGARECLRSGHPALIDLDRSYMMDISIDHLVGALGPGNRRVRIYGETRMKQARDAWNSYCEFEYLAPATYAEWLREGVALRRSAYMAQVDLEGTRLDSEIEEWTGELCNALFPAPLSGLNLWLGPGGHREPLHFDPADGLLVQLAGTKHITLFPPQVYQGLYPFAPWSRIRPWFSRVDLSAPDMERFPKLGEALSAALEIDLHRGQALAIPAGWWHDVRSVGTSYTCSVNRFFRVRPLRRLLQVYLGVPLYTGLVNRRLVLSLERMVRRIPQGS